MVNAQSTPKAGWEVKTLGEVCEFARGLTYKKTDEVDHSSNAVLRANNVSLETKSLNFDKIKFIHEDIEIPESKKVRNGSLLICTASGSKKHLGKVALIDADYAYAFGGFMGLLTPHENISSKYFFYSLTGKEYENFIAELSDGANINNLKFSQLQEFRITVPPLAEQERIVGILDEAFEGIAAATAQAEKNLHNARELFQSVLQSTFSPKGDDWVEKTLKEMAKEFGRGKSKHRPRNADFLYGGQYPFVQTGDIRNSDHLITKYSQTYSEEGLAQSKLWPEGTVCITIAANIAETGILNFDACFPDSVIGMIPDPEKSIGGYIEYLLQFFKVELQRQGKGSAQDNINLGTFKDQTFPFAPVNKQQAIVEKLDALSEETKRLEAIYERKKAALTELKQSLLQKAFAGEL